MGPFASAEKANQFLTDAVGQTDELRTQLVQRVGFDRCFYEGLQLWTQRFLSFTSTSMGRKYQTWDPDAKNLNIVINRTTQHVNKSISATFPEKVYVDGMAPENDSSMQGAVIAQLLETLTNDLIDWSEYLPERRAVNVSRCITGTAGLAWYIYDGFRLMDIDGEKLTVPSKELLCREIDPIRLVLDPAVRSQDLRQHEYVVYEDFWPLEKIKAVFGVELRPEDCKTIGELTGNEQKMASLSAGRLYSQYVKYSRTKGARVYQVHVRTEPGRFGLYYTAVEGADDNERRWTNLDNPETPFGGCGLPIALFYGLPRADSMWGIGDVAMLRDDQSKLNMIASIVFRQLRAAAGYQMRYDPRGMPKNMQVEEYEQRFTNRVAGVIPFEPRTREVLPPELMKYPPPDQTILGMIQTAEADMQGSVFRARANYGEVKSHVPDATVSRVLREVDSVANVRIKQDVETDAWFLTVGLSTAVKLAQSGNPGVLARMSRTGQYDEHDFADLSRLDCYGLPVKLVVRESSVRVRPPEERKADLIRMSQSDIGAYTPSELRLAFADMDMPGSDEDRRMHASLRRAIGRVAAGVDWEPIPLGPFAEWALSMLRLVAVNARRRGDRETERRAIAAILAQQQVDLEEKINNDPNVAIQRMQAQAQMQQQAQQAQEQPEEPEPQTVGELLDRMSA